MASSMMHIAVAKEVNKKLKRNEKELFLGTIAPDISMQVGQDKSLSHFLQENDEEDIPHLEWFLAKYRKHLDDDFVMGYFIHLCTDYLWFKYFIPEIGTKQLITTIDGKDIKVDDETYRQYIYQDYTNLNITLLDEYDLDLSLFYEKLPEVAPIIEEIPMDKLQLIVDAASIIIKNSKEKKSYLFNMKHIYEFIELSTELILSMIQEVEITDGI